MKRFCVKCGKEESEDIPILDGLCIKCYTQARKLLEIPKLVEVTVCSRCGALSIGNRWIYPATAAEAKGIVERHVASLIRNEQDVYLEELTVDIDETTYRRAKVYADVLIKNRALYRVESDIEIRWKKNLCPTCFRRVGGGFEAVVQMRFMNYEEDRIERFKTEVAKLFYDHIVEIEEVENGINIKVSSQGVARRIADIASRIWRNAKISESFGDIKRLRNGSRYGRLYISLRIFNPREGDYIVLNGKAYTVDRVHDNGVDVLDSDGRKISVPLDKLLESCTKIRRRTR